VVGPTGSGKSTLMKLLTRLYEIDQGAIRIGGRDVRDLPVDAVRRRVTVVSQDVFMFAGTVADNVRLGTGASDADVDRALAAVGLDRILARRATPGAALRDLAVTERGTNFSAGERQLLAFARALVRDPPILVLDEATAHVDPESERLIEAGVATLMKGRTTLVIAHRLSTIRNADLIAVIDRGVVVEQGTHDQLVAAGGVYAALERTFHRAAADA
jgi:ATP-binding cassette subfamily B protein